METEKCASGRCDVPRQNRYGVGALEFPTQAFGSCPGGYGAEARESRTVVSEPRSNRRFCS